MIYLELFLSFLQIGLFSFGGGYAAMPLIQGQVVNGHHWLSMTEFTDLITISQMTPGPIGINSATYIGYAAPGQAGFSGIGWGILGSVMCTVVVVVPSFLLVLYMSHFISRHKESVAVRGIFRGLRPVLVGLIASAALLLMNNENFGYEQSEILISVLIALVSLAVVLFTKIHPILIIVLAGVAGAVLYY